MFDKLRKRWHEARGDVLKKEFVDTMQRLMSASSSEELVTKVAEVCLSELGLFKREYGEISNTSNAFRREYAKRLVSLASSVFDRDLSRSYGISLAAIYIESHALPGVDALTVRNALKELVTEWTSEYSEKKKNSKQAPDAKLVLNQSPTAASAAELTNDDTWVPVSELDGQNLKSAILQAEGEEATDSNRQFSALSAAFDTRLLRLGNGVEKFENFEAACKEAPVEELYVMFRRFMAADMKLYARQVDGQLSKGPNEERQLLSFMMEMLSRENIRRGGGHSYRIPWRLPILGDQSRTLSPRNPMR